MNLIPLQFIARANNTTVFVTLGILGLLILLMVASGKGRRSGSRLSTGGKAGYSKRAFTKLAKQYQLEAHHVQILQKAIKDQNITNPDRLFPSGPFLDRTLQRLISAIGTSNISQERKNRIVAEVFEIKQRIENSSSKEIGAMRQTRNLKLGQEITIYSELLPPVQSRVTANLDSYIVVTTPLNANGSPIKYPPGSVLKIRLVIGGNNVYVFTSKLKQARAVNGIESMLIDHSSKVEHNQLRKDLRKEVKIVAYFQQVKIITEGNRKHAVVNKKSQSVGQIEDISRGGCALYSPRSMKRGDLIKLRFNLGSANDVSVFGKIQHTSTRAPIGVLMHIAFTRVSVHTLNEIQSHVFGFSEN